MLEPLQLKSRLTKAQVPRRKPSEERGWGETEDWLQSSTCSRTIEDSKGTNGASIVRWRKSRGSCRASGLGSYRRRNEGWGKWRRPKRRAEQLWTPKQVATKTWWTRRKQLVSCGLHRGQWCIRQHSSSWCTTRNSHEATARFQGLCTCRWSYHPNLGTEDCSAGISMWTGADWNIFSGG